MSTLPVPIIFLDVHGVLTNATTKFLYGDRDKLDPVSVRLVEKLADECGAGIVITSSIADDLNERQLRTLLCDIGGKRLVPYIHGVIEEGPIGARSSRVTAYLLSLPVGTPYVILDDKPDLFQPAQHVVAIDPQAGFKVQYYSAAAAYLCDQ